MIDRPGLSQPTDNAFKPLYRIGAIAALIVVVLIPIQSAIFIAWPPPTTAGDYFALPADNWLLGLLSLDLLYLVDNALMGLIYLALYGALRRTSPPLMAIALGLGLVGLAAHFSSNTAFEMLALSRQYAAATTDAQRTIWLAAGEAMPVVFQGTAFDAHYVLNGVVLLLLAFVMLHSGVFSRTIAYWGLAAGILMVPSTAGTIGLIFALASLVPWAVFSVLFARRLLRLAGP